MSGNSTPKAPKRGDKAPAKKSKLSFQNRYNREARLSRAWLLRHQPEVLRRIVRQVEREGSSPRTRGAFVRNTTKTRKKERVPLFTLIRLVTEAQEETQVKGDNSNG